MIRLGTRLSSNQKPGTGFRIISDDSVLIRHLDRPWLRAYACERLGLPLPKAQVTESSVRPVVATAEQLSRHCVACGSTGSGKTRLALQLLFEQMKAGCSVVMLDPKIETIRHLLVMARSAGINPDQITLLMPANPDMGGVPGWNPLDWEQSGILPVQAASDFVSVLAQSTGSWGPRLQDLLTNALIVIASHRLSLYELARFLQRDSYREALLAIAPDAPDPVAFQEAHDYFVAEFARWSNSERASAVAPVMNKLREFLRTSFLRSLLCARKNTLNLPSLWGKQQLILVHLDRTSLGDEGARLLGGLLTWQLYRTAMRTEGPVPVCLSLDEMGVSEQFVGKAVCEILAIARSRKLRLLVACQHLAQLSEDLRGALLANTAVRAFFQLGYQDAKVVAASLAAGTGEEVTTIEADASSKKDPLTGEIAHAEVSHQVVDGWGNAIRLSRPAWSELEQRAVPELTGLVPYYGLNAAPESPLERLKQLAVLSGIPRLYVHAADTGEPVELSHYVQGLRPEDYRFFGPTPVRVLVRFPRPRLSVVSKVGESERRERWTRTLMDLPVARAVVVLSPEAPVLTRVVAVPDPDTSPGFEKYLSVALVSGGQSVPEITETYEWRRLEVERLEGGDGEIVGKGAKTMERRVSEKGRLEKSAARENTPVAKAALPLPALGEVSDDGSIA